MTLSTRDHTETKPLPCRVSMIKPSDYQCAVPAKYSSLMSLFDDGSFEQHFQPDSTVALHGAPADAVYLIVSGTVRCSTINADGCRQIFRFSRKGDFLGFADINTWHFTAEAVDHVIVKSIPRAEFEYEVSVDFALQQEMRGYFRELLTARENQLLTLVSTKAADRLFQFLGELSDLRRHSGYIALPMCRRDIADHLGLSVETVSRAFSELKRTHRIDLVSCEKFKLLETCSVNNPSPSLDYFA